MFGYLAIDHGGKSKPMLKSPFFWLIAIQILVFVNGYRLYLSAPSVKRAYYGMPRWLQKAFVLPIVIPSWVLPLLPQPRFESFSSTARAVGLLFVVIGALLLFLAFREFEFIPAAVPKEQKKRIVNTGIYGVIRNPIYSANVAIALGLALFFHAIYALAYIPFFALLFVINTLLEERELKTGFGEEHLNYMKEVPCRFIPRIV